MSALDFSINSTIGSDAPYGVPDLQASDASSSSSNSHLPSPDNYLCLDRQNNNKDAISHPIGLPTPYQRQPTIQHKHHPYSRIDIKDLINHSNSSTLSKEKKRQSTNASTLEQSIRKGLQIANKQKYCRAPNSSSNSNQMVSCLVDLAVMTIDHVWGPLSKDSNKNDKKSLHHYVTEILRRSRVTKTVVQFALIYCLRVKETVAITRQLLESRVGENATQNAAFCGRRMFLASLICASKYLQDANFSNKTWAKIVGLTPFETSLTEASFLRLLDYKLYLGELEFYPYAKAILDQASISSPVSSSAYFLIQELFPKESKKHQV